MAAVAEESEPSLAWYLERMGGEEAGQRLKLQPGAEVTVGRGLGVTHRLLAKTCPLMISRNHCSFFLSSEGVCTVTDNQSLNGVWVNGVRLEPLQPWELVEGDVVQLGVPVEQQERAEYEYRLVRRSPGRPGTGSGAKRKLGCEDSPIGVPQRAEGSSKLQRLGENTHRPDTVQQRVLPTAQSREDAVQPGTSSQSPTASCTNICHGDQDRDQESTHRHWVQELPMDREQTHRDQDQELSTDWEQTQGHYDQKFPVGREPSLGDREQDQGYLINQEPTDGDREERCLTNEQKPQVGVGIDVAETRISEVLENELQCIICSEYFIQGARTHSAGCVSGSGGAVGLNAPSAGSPSSGRRPQWCWTAASRGWCPVWGRQPGDSGSSYCKPAWRCWQTEGTDPVGKVTTGLRALPYLQTVHLHSSLRTQNPGPRGAETSKPTCDQQWVGSSRDWQFHLKLCVYSCVFLTCAYTHVCIHVCARARLCVCLSVHPGGVGGCVCM